MGDSTPDRPRILVAVEDESVRERLREILDETDLDLDLIAPEVDPLTRSPANEPTLMLIRRSSVQQKDLRLVDEYTDDEANPGLIVLQDKSDAAERTRLLAAGASGVVEETRSDEELREAIEAIVQSEEAVAPPSEASGPSVQGARLADFFSRSPRMIRFLATVERVVDSDSSLLITGETGVGKEHLAEAIHKEGLRRNGPFVSVNCGALPETLLESELFGHESGAFTGAKARRKGRFELADGGTIFLDEIGEMASHLQVKLLTVLQRRSVRRVGGEATVPIDVRVIAATNRDVVGEVERGRFREDLYYRLNVVGLEIPSLRERKEDIPDLAGRFIREARDSLGRREVESVADDALEAMREYEWPGNVRELRNAVEHALVLCQGRIFTVEDLPETVVGRARPPRGRARELPEGDDGLAIGVAWLEGPLKEAKRRLALEFEKRYLEGLLRRSEGRIAETARHAGISPRSLYEKMKVHGLDKDDYR